MTFDKAIACDPKFAGVYFDKGVTLGLLGRYDEALEALDKAIACDPKFAEANHNRGIIYQELGKHKEAEKDFQKAKDLGLKLE